MEVLLWFMVFVSVAMARAEPEEKYTTKYDDVDLDEILSNQRLYQKYFDCIVGRGKCTPDGQELKDGLPDALENRCSKCSDKQVKGTEKVVRFLAENKPEDFKLLESIYDKEHHYRTQYKDDFESKGIKLPDLD